MFIAMWVKSGTILQISATTAAQFTVGRITCYFMTGTAQYNTVYGM